MYHRIAAETLDPWQLCVRAEHFEQQVAVLTKKFAVISAEELINGLQKKRLPQHAVCLSFDDGYADNYLFAKPILEKWACPATFFIPSAFTGQHEPFWWDALQAILLTAPQLPQHFQMSIQDETVEQDLEEEATLTQEQKTKNESWRLPQSAPTKRFALFLKIWEHLKPLPHAEIQAVVNEIKTWANYNPVYPDALLPMNKEQLKNLSQHPLFSIGLHTATHPALAYHPEEAQYVEIAENKKALQPFEPINAVAFPYGNYNNSTISVLKRQRLDAGFTTEARAIPAAANPLCLGRFPVTDQTGDSFEKQLRFWLKA